MAAADRHDELAVAIEGGVQRAVDIQTNQAEVIVGAIVGIAGHEDLAVGLQAEALAIVFTTADRHEDLAVAIKGSVQRPVGIQADQAEIIADAIAGDASHQDLAVGLHGEATATVVTTTNRHK